MPKLLGPASQTGERLLQRGRWLHSGGRRWVTAKSRAPIAIGRAYIGSGGASPLAGTNIANAKEDGVIKDGFVSISCLATCSAPTDTTVWTGRARTDGTFDVTGLETGDYSVAFWDETQNYIMDIEQYHVTSGATVVSATATPTTAPTVTFATNPNLVVGNTVFFTSADPTWNGNFQVMSVSPDGLTVTLQVVNGTNTNPTADATSLPTVNVTDVGHILLPGWFTDLQGSIFNDLNGNGIRDTCAASCPRNT